MIFVYHLPCRQAIRRNSKFISSPVHLQGHTHGATQGRDVSCNCFCIALPLASSNRRKPSLICDERILIDVSAADNACPVTTPMRDGKWISSPSKNGFRLPTAGNHQTHALIDLKIKQAIHRFTRGGLTPKEINFFSRFSI